LLRPPVKTGFCTVGCPQWHIFFQYAGDIFFENKFILKKMKKEEQRCLKFVLFLKNNDA
jgi:hypothetical protein